MVDRDTVETVHAEFQTMLSEAMREREHPRIVRILELLCTLTDTGEAKPAAAIAAPEEQPSDAEEHTQAAAPCEHKVVDVYGRCKGCGECQHTNVRGGTCLTCDKEMPA